MKSHIFVLTALVWGGLVASAVGCASSSPATESGAQSSGDGDAVAAAEADLSGKRGAKMQPFTLPSVDGRPFDTTSVLGRDVVMVSFWATWCSPCKAELSRMSSVYDRLEKRGFTYLAVSTDSPTDVGKAKSYVSGYGYRFPVLLDSQGTLLQRYNPRGDLPFFLIINRRGEIVEQHQGFSPGDEVLIEKKLESLL